MHKYVSDKEKILTKLYEERLYLKNLNKTNELDCYLKGYQAGINEMIEFIYQDIMQYKPNSNQLNSVRKKLKNIKYYAI